MLWSDVGSIVMLGASNEIIAKGLRIASHVLEAAVSDIEFDTGRFVVKGTDRSIGIFEVAAAAAQRNDLPDDLRKLDGIGDETINLAAFPYGCHVCEVEIDPDTGVVSVVNYSAVDDVGRAVNPLIVHGQVHGGIAHGIGQALLEQVHWIYVVALASLIAVRLFGQKYLGARRWIKMPGGAHFQPSEWVKLILILAVAKYFADLQQRELSWSDFMKAGAIVGFPMLLVLVQPDLGTALTYLPVAIMGFPAASSAQLGRSIICGKCSCS